MTIKNIYLTLLSVLSLMLLACDNDDSPSDTHAEVIMKVSETTTWWSPWEGEAPTGEYMLVKEPSDTEWKKLAMGSIKGFEYTHGHAYELEVRKTTLANPPADGSMYTYKLIRIISDTPVSTPEPDDELPDEAKFKLKMTQLVPFMELETTLAAPFDFLTFRILDNQDEFSFLQNPKFLQYYDSIVMSSPVMPNTYRVYQKYKDEGYEGESFTSQWGSYFFEKSEFPLSLKGYKDGEVIYEHSILQRIWERDFLCVDWKHGSVTLANPQTHAIDCILDSRYEFLLTDTQMRNDTPFVEIRVASSPESSESDDLIKQATGLKWLLNEYLDVQTSLNTSKFKTLPEGSNVEEIYENSTTRCALIHRLRDYQHEECYYAIAEPK